MFLLSRYEDILEVNAQPEAFSSILVANAPYTDPPAPLDELAEWRASQPFSDKILSNDPPDHTRHKRLINRFFTPRHVAALEPRVREITNEIIDAFIDRGEVEFVTEFSHMLPRLVVGELIGLPPDDARALQAVLHGPAGGDGEGGGGPLGRLPAADRGPRGDHGEPVPPGLLHGGDGGASQRTRRATS